MFKISLTDPSLLVQGLLYVRQRLALYVVIIFIIINLFEILIALKISIFMALFLLMGEKAKEEIYDKYYSFENFEILANLLTYGLLTFIIFVFVIFFLDTFGIKGSLKTPEFRRLKRSLRRDMKQLEDQGRLQANIGSAQDIKDLSVKLLLKMEEIVKRYEYTATALNPDSFKRTKLSEADKSIKDLFDYAEDKKDQKEKAKSLRKIVKFKPKF